MTGGLARLLAALDAGTNDPAAAKDGGVLAALNVRRRNASPAGRRR